MAREPAKARARPCPTCPFRRDCPSGLWAPEEYDRLLAYDGEIADQAMAGGGLDPFHCHTAPDALCSGWAGHRPAHELLAIRIGVAVGRVAASVMRYTTTVPLFGSGAEAAEHGKRDMRHPGAAARRAVTKIVRARAAAGEPVRVDGEERLR